MANEIRLRSNNISGAITDNPLTNVATTINSPGFVDLPVVNVTNHLVLILDPLEVNGAAEVVTVTAHTAASSSVTVVRGAEGSSARTHILGTTWFHGPVVSDWTNIVTSGTRPSPAYKGSVIYETDTNKLMVFNGTDWNPNQAGGQLGYAQVVASQSGITTQVDITGLTTTVTVGTNRRVKITGYALGRNGTANSGVAVFIMEGGTQMQQASSRNPVASEDAVYNPIVVITPSVGLHSYKLQAVASGGGTVQITAGALLPAFILVEDIGAA